MTRFGEFLDKRSVNKAEIARRTGIRKNRLSELSLQESSRPRGDEIYLIALAMGVDPCELFRYVYEGLTLKNEN